MRYFLTEKCWNSEIIWEENFSNLPHSTCHIRTHLWSILQSTHTTLTSILYIHHQTRKRFFSRVLNSAKNQNLIFGYRNWFFFNLRRTRSARSWPSYTRTRALVSSAGDRPVNLIWTSKRPRWCRCVQLGAAVNNIFHLVRPLVTHKWLLKQTTLSEWWQLKISIRLDANVWFIKL